MKKTLLASLVLGAVLAFGASAGETKEFHIAKGTGDGPWNKASETVEVKVGDTLRIINDDTVDHQLHTNGSPCEHGTNMAPGEHYDCVIESPFDATKSGNLYDHHVGPTAPFFVHASAAFDE